MRATLLLLASATLSAACVAEPLAVEAADDADVVVVADDIFYGTERIEVVAGVPTRIHLRNEGAIVHDLVLSSGWQSGEVRPGEAINVTMVPLDASAVAWCSIPGHRSAGMELVVDVVEPTA